MEDSIKELAGKTFKKLIKSYTGTKGPAILSGTISTAILQSSSAINLMVLAFVGAGIMSLASAIGVILGANVGTTLTAWMVAFFGFKISIESFALPIIAVGGLGFILFVNSERYLNISKLIIGFGLLFHGLDYMKTSVDQITQLFDVTMLSGYGLWVFVIAGLLITAIVQSSSATIAIILTAINSGIMGFESGAAMVIGANIGTTVTVTLGAIGGIPIKKRVAVGHFVFNMATAIIAFILLPVLIWFIQHVVGWGGNGILGVALFHTLFNVLGVVLFLPFIGQMTSSLEQLFKEPERIVTHYIQNTAPDITDAATEAFTKEILHQYAESRRYLIRLYKLRLPQTIGSGDTPTLQSLIEGSVSDVYWQLKELHGNIFEYYSHISVEELDPKETKLLNRLLRSSRSIMNATKNLKDIKGDLEDFELSDKGYLNQQFSIFQDRLAELFQDLDGLVTTEEVTGADFDKVLERVDKHDMTSINESSAAIKREELRDTEATSMVMVNRLFTQSCRMLVFSIRSLQEAIPAPDTETV